MARFLAEPDRPVQAIVACFEFASGLFRPVPTFSITEGTKRPRRAFGAIVIRAFKNANYVALLAGPVLVAGVLILTYFEIKATWDRNRHR
jgi:hypothetical protein